MNLTTVNPTRRYNQIADNHANPCVAVAQSVIGQSHFAGEIAYEVNEWNGEAPKTLAQLSREMDLTAGKFVAYCANVEHVMAISNGKVYDYGSPARKRIQMIVKL